MLHNRSRINNNFNKEVSNYIGQPHIKPLEFQITRHATSCFNIEIYSDSMLPGLGALLTSDKIPSLASYGIANTIALAYKNRENNRFQSPLVNVSSLIRTWMTAVLLYAFKDKSVIILRICPHLREVGGKGNGAFPLRSSIPKFMTFLELIRGYNDYKSLRQIILLIPKTIEEPHTEWVPIYISIPEVGPVQNDPLFCTINDTVDKIDGYQTDGHITTFMQWFHRSFPEEQEKVHVVAHSGIMKSQFKEIYRNSRIPFNIKTHIVANIPIEEQNCWTYTIPLGKIDKNKLIDSIQPGYKNPGKGGLEAAQESEISKKGTKNKKGTSLCFDSVVPIECPTKGGKQKRTRKHHSKHHSKHYSKSRR